MKVAEQIVGVRVPEPREQIIARYTAAVQSIVDQNPDGAPLVVSVREVGLMNIHVNEDGQVTLTPRPPALP
ncbi:hypothetical protein B7R21_17945 [Subtercola boreus]|uniref:Uncharacterized protein n=1 Tax=Subtercola boreus TaxID=120213 RepID=A0A3E0VAP9_9MICO|nr:hypothetical protein B7R21_17945 [Subtercola boreus]